MLPSRPEIMVIVAMLNVVAIISSVSGFQSLNPMDPGVLDGLHASLFFILAFGANVLSLVSIGLNMIDVVKDSISSYLYSCEYFLSWLGIVFGYSRFVSHFWKAYNLTFFTYIHCWLPALVMLTWLSRSNHAILEFTKLTARVNMFFHCVLCLWANDLFGLAGIVSMLGTILSLSHPHNLFYGFSSTEVFKLSLSIGTCFFGLASNQLAQKIPAIIANTPNHPFSFKLEDASVND